MPPPCGFSLPCAVAFVVGIGRCREVSGQANVYDTATTDAFRITCNPAPGKCDIGDLFSLYSAMIHPMNGITGNPTDGGLIRLDTESAYFVAGGCKPQKNCTILCDDNCGCETGGFALDDVGGRWFASDGGSCAVLDTTPGDVRTDAPTPVPTSSPTFDKAEAILYDFTGLAQPSVMRISGCIALGGGPFDSYCELWSGIYRYTITTNSFYGVSECGRGRALHPGLQQGLQLRNGY